MTTVASKSRADAKVAIICGSIVVAMVGLAYASVPLYRLFCQITGFAGTTQKAIAPSTVVLDRKVTVRFDANTAPGLPWSFEPVENKMELKVGENGLAIYRASNRSNVPVIGTATFNVTPEQAGGFFNKLQCFCFQEQRLEPGETVDMPVSFFVDPAMVDDADGRHIRTITLSYTFHPVVKAKATTTASESLQPTDRSPDTLSEKKPKG